jgi:hypothetical protein
MAMSVPASKPRRQVVRWVVWTVLGAVVSGAVGALSLQVAGGRGVSEETVRVEVFGRVVYRETGPFGTMDRVILWGSVTILGVFILIGAAVGALVAWIIGKAASAPGQP